MLVFIQEFDTVKIKNFQIQPVEVWCGVGALKSICVCELLCLVRVCVYICICTYIYVYTLYMHMYI
jgi:hypothetical protein